MALGRSVEMKYALTKEEAEQKYINNAAVNNKRAEMLAVTNPFKKVKTISEIDPLDSLPIVIRILLDLQNKLPQDNEKLEQTRKTVDAAIDIFYEVDILQNSKSISAIRQYFTDKDITRETIKPYVKNLLQGLIDKIQVVAITEDTKDLWQECASWLDGLYHRTYDQMPKDANGNPKKDKNGDYEYIGAWGVGLDFIFKKATGGLTKMAISYYYGEATKLLEEKIKSYTDSLDQVDQLVDGLDEQPEIPLEKGKEEAEQEAPPAKQEVKVENKPVEESYYEGTIKNTIIDYPTAGNTHTLKLTVSKKHAAMLKEVSEEVDELLNNPLLSGLRASMDKEESVRLQNFEASLVQHGLSKRQSIKLAKLGEFIQSELVGYTDNSRIRNFIGDYVPYVGTTHRAEVKSALDKISTLAEPKDQLLELFKLRSHLKKGQSVEMLPVVTKILLVQLERICPKRDSRMLDYSAMLRQLQVDSGMDFYEVPGEERDLVEGYEKYQLVTQKGQDKTLTLGLTVDAKDEAILQEVKAVVKDMMSNPLAYELRNDAEISLDARLQNFRASLEKYKLNGRQEAEMSNLGSIAANELALYFNSSTIRPMIGSFFTSMDLAHRKLIQDCIEFMNKVPDPYEQLIELFTLRSELQSKGSRTALPIVTEVLRQQMERLCTRPRNHTVDVNARLQALRSQQSQELIKQDSSTNLSFRNM